MIVLIRSSLNSLIASWGIWPQAANALFKTTKPRVKACCVFLGSPMGSPWKKSLKSGVLHLTICQACPWPITTSNTESLLNTGQMDPPSKVEDDHLVYVRACGGWERKAALHINTNVRAWYSHRWHLTRKMSWWEFPSPCLFLALYKSWQDELVLSLRRQSAVLKTLKMSFDL